MKCPHCNGILPSMFCPECDKEIPEKSLFCCWCGTSVEPGEEIDFSLRQLCSDGNCIGIINEQGICSVCKKPYTPPEGGGG